ncbi:hypothetical protein EGW08_002606, partial [Elysia chlorotica]
LHHLPAEPVWPADGEQLVELVDALQVEPAAVEGLAQGLADGAAVGLPAGQEVAPRRTLGVALGQDVKHNVVQDGLHHLQTNTYSHVHSLMSYQHLQHPQGLSTGTFPYHVHITTQIGCAHQNEALHVLLADIIDDVLN